MSRLKKTYNVKDVFDKKLEAVCLTCGRSTKHEMLTLVAENGETRSINFDFWYVKNHQIIQCLGCESISFRIEEFNSEDTNFDDEQEALIPYVSETLFPSRSAGRNGLKDTLMLPVNVQRIYIETISAMNNAQPVLTGIGIRAIVETVCKDKSTKGKDLKEKIDSLVSLGLLTSEGAVILHKIRTLGNDAAHEVKPHKPDQLALAMDVCEHLLQGVYLLPHYASQTFK